MERIDMATAVTPVQLPTLEGELLKLIRQRQTLKTAIEANESKVKQLDEQIMSHMVSEGVSICANKDFKVSVVERAGHPTLNKEKLVELGVSLKTISAATTTSKPSAYVRVTTL
jgi:hypothetical protein